jgi:hypothetical protein
VLTSAWPAPACLQLALVAVVCLLGHSCSCLKQEAALGAYLGCFPLQHILSLAGVQQTGVSRLLLVRLQYGNLQQQQSQQQHHVLKVYHITNKVTILWQLKEQSSSRQQAATPSMQWCQTSFVRGLRCLHLLPLVTQEAPHTHSTLFKCAAACRQGNFSLIIVSTELRCWCALATPDSSQQLQDSACNAGGQGAAVFYQDAREYFLVTYLPC